MAGRMPSTVRPKNAIGANRPTAGTPMSERQQMALLMQMTSPTTTANTSAQGSRSPSTPNSFRIRDRDRNERGETPLHLAAIKGDAEHVAKLLAHRSDPNATDFAGWTPLHEACNHGWYEVASKLLQAGANVNARGLDDDTPLHDAASNGHVKLVRLLVEHGADVHAKNKKGKTPCDIAAVSVQPLLITDTAAGQRVQSRPRDEKKVQSDSVKKTATPMDTVEQPQQQQQQQPQQTMSSKTTVSNPVPSEDVFEFKTTKESTVTPETKSGSDPIETHQSEAVDPLSTNTPSVSSSQNDENTTGTNTSGTTVPVAKRAFDEGDDVAPDDEVRRKKRKDSDGSVGGGGKDGKLGPQTARNTSQVTKSTKTCGLATAKQNADRKSPCPTPSPKPSTVTTSSTSAVVASTIPTGDEQTDDSKSDLKVPPLKIVIPQSATNNEQESSGNRNGKNSSQRTHQALPYVVASGTGDCSPGVGVTVGTSTATTTTVTATLSTEDSATVVSSMNSAGASDAAGTGANVPVSSKGVDEKKDVAGSASAPVADDQKSSYGGHHQRVLRSSHRSGGTSTSSSTNVSGGGGSNTNDRSSNNSSPLLQRSHSPSPNSSPASVTQPSTVTMTTTVESKETVTATATPTTTSTSGTITQNTNTTSTNNSSNSNSASGSGSGSGSGTKTVMAETQPQASTSADLDSNSGPSGSNAVVPTSSQSNNSSGSSSSGSGSSTPAATVELHPRKRKMRPNKETLTVTSHHDNGGGTGNGNGGDASATVSEVHPHDQPITNCYQLYLNIRKQIERRRKSLFPVQPKPPQGFKDYLMNRCTYVLAGTAPTVPNVAPPASLPAPMRELFTEQEKERYKLRMQHVIEKEKLVLSVEQEILRVHGRAARALANQSLPFSVCTVLRDEEVYNIITPEQEEKDRNARSRYNGRLFLSWLQDVDDKWEKIKEHMLLRHHNEAESLHAVQRMDWEWKLKELSLCEYKATPHIDDMHVPMVHVSDDFDLLPA